MGELIQGQRGKMISFRVTEEEFETYFAISKAKGYSSVSAYARDKMAEPGNPDDSPRELVENLLDHLQTARQETLEKLFEVALGSFTIGAANFLAKLPKAKKQQLREVLSDLLSENK